MADSATTSNRLRKQSLASNVAVWGDPYLNTNFDLLDSLADGVTTIALGTATATTLTSTNYAADESRNRVLVLTGTGTQTTTITNPQVSKNRLIINQSAGAVVFISATGTGCTVSAGQNAWIYSDGTNYNRGDPTLDKVRAPTAAVDFNSQRLTGLAAGTASSDAMRVGEAQTYVDTASAWALTTGSAVTGTNYSARAWAVGGSGQPPGGAAKNWAMTTGSSVDGTGFGAKDWAAGTGTNIDGTYKSARSYSLDGSGWASTASGWSSTASGWASTASGWNSTASGWNSTASGWSGTASGWAGTASGWNTTASQWATTTGSAVSGTDYSARAWAIGGSAQPPGGAAKNWAMTTGSTVDGTGYGAKDWAAGTGSTVDGTYASARAYSIAAAGVVGRYYAAMAGTNTLTGTGTPTVSAWALNNMVSFTTPNANTGGVAFILDTAGTKTLLDGSAAALVSGGLLPSVLYQGVYDGTSVRLPNAYIEPYARSFQAAQRGTIATFTGTGTATLNFNSANYFSGTVSANMTLGNGTNATAGQGGSIRLFMGTASPTISLGANWKYPGGTAPSFSTASGKIDRMDYWVVSSTEYHYNLATGVA